MGLTKSSIVWFGWNWRISAIAEVVSDTVILFVLNWYNYKDRFNLKSSQLIFRSTNFFDAAGVPKTTVHTTVEYIYQLREQL
jgi:hypothetical protein